MKLEWIELASAELSGRALDWAVACKEGHVWAKNMSKRSGDSMARYREPDALPKWPIGSLCFVCPSSGKSLTAEVPNWDGWCLPDMEAPLAPNAFYDLPRYSTDWATGGPLLDKYRVGFAWYTEGMLAVTDNGSAMGATHLIAHCRALVVGAFGDRVKVPAVLAEAAG